MATTNVKKRSAPKPQEERPAWTFLTNHAHVLLSVARDPEVRIRDLAQLVGITERAVQRILADLENDGYITHEREGRRNTYRVHANMHLRHSVESKSRIALLLRLVGIDDAERRPKASIRR